MMAWQPQSRRLSVSDKNGEGAGSNRDALAAVLHLMAKHKLTKEQAAGVVGHLMELDDLRPWHPANAGFRADRYDRMTDWASSRNLLPQDLSTQLSFLMWELYDSAYTKLGARLTAAATAKEAVIVFAPYVYPNRVMIPLDLHKQIQNAQSLLTTVAGP